MILRYKEFIPKIDNSVFIAPSADIIGDVVIGKDSSIWFGSVIRADVHYIRIGKRVSIQDLAMVHVTHFKKSRVDDRGLSNCYKRSS